MFDQLFRRRHALARHRSGPLLEERLAYLTHLADRGCSRNTLQNTACDLLAIAKILGLASGRHKIVTRDDIKRKTASKHSFYPIAVRWLQFVGRLQQQPAAANPYAKKIKPFADHMERDRGLSPVTIRGRCWFITRFLNRLKIKGGSLRKITSHRIDVSLKEMLDQQGYARTTIRSWAEGLRNFFRFAETQGWCRKGLAACVRGPHVFSQASLPLGPSWSATWTLASHLAVTPRPLSCAERETNSVAVHYGQRRWTNCGRSLANEPHPSTSSSTVVENRSHDSGFIPSSNATPQKRQRKCRQWRRSV